MVIKLKKIYFILFLTSLLVLLLGLFSTSYATFSSSTLQDLNDNLQVLQDRGLLSQDFMQNFSFDNPRWGEHYVILITNESVDNVYIAYGYNGSKIINRDTIDWKTNGDTVTNVGCKQYTNKNTNNNGRPGTSWGGFPGNNYTYVYAYSPYYEIDTNALQLDSGAEYGDNYFTGPSANFIPNEDYVVSFNNHNNVGAILRNYSVNQWKIGETENFSELDAFMFLLNDLTLGYRVGNVTGYRALNQISGNGALYFKPNDLYVNSRYIQYNHLYELIVSKTVDNNETLEYFYFVFLPRNAVISNGQIINSGSGDYSVQDSTNAIIENQESGDNKIIGALTDDSEIDSILENEFTSNSGDIEVYADKFGFTALDNPFTTFLLHILDSTFDALTEPNDVVLSADYKTLHFELNSGDFTTPESPLKDFIRNLLIFLYIYGNYRFFNHLIVLIQTAKIDKAIATLGTDEFYDSDIM